MMLTKAQLVQVVDDELQDRTVTKSECYDAEYEAALIVEIADLQALKDKLVGEKDMSFSDYSYLADLVATAVEYETTLKLANDQNFP